MTKPKLILILSVVSLLAIAGIKFVVFNNHQSNQSKTNLAQAQGSLNIPLTIQEALKSGETGINRTQDPVTVGLPLPEDSGITNINQLGLSGAGVGQFRALAWWPNGNIKWVLVDTEVDVQAGGTNKNISLVAGSGNFGGSNLAEDAGVDIDVNTGGGSFKIKKSGFNLFDYVNVNDQELVSPDTSEGIVLGQIDGTLFKSINDANSKVVIEENGPVRTVIKAEGALKDTSGNEYLWYTARMHFYYDKSYVKVFFSLRNANQDSPTHKSFKYLDLHTKVNTQGQMSFFLANHTGATNGAFTQPDETAYIYQAYAAFPRTVQYRVPTIASGYLSPIAVTGLDPSGKAVPGTIWEEEGYTIKQGDTILAQGNKSQYPQGWLDIQDSTGAGAQVGVRYIAGNWPKSLESDGNGNVKVGLWPKYKESISYNDTINRYWLPLKSHETYEVLYNFHSNNLSETELQSQMKSFEYPLIGRISDFAWYRQSGAIEHSDLITRQEEVDWYNRQGLNAPPLSSASFYWYSHVPEKINIIRFFAYGQAGGGNQFDFRREALYKFLQLSDDSPSETENWLYTEQWIHHNTDRAIPRTDGFVVTGPPTYGSIANNFAPVNPQDEDKISLGGRFDIEHEHWYHIPFWYFLTGDERMKDAIYDFMEDRNYTIWAGDVRYTSRQLWNLVEFHRFARDIRDNSQANHFMDLIQQTLTQYINLPRNELADNKVSCTSPSRGYTYTDINISQNLGYASIHGFVSAEIFPEALWHAYILLPEGKLKEDVHDTIIGLVRFFYNEWWVELNSGINYLDYGIPDFVYDYNVLNPLSQYAKYPGEGIAPNEHAGYVDMPFMRQWLMGYEFTGDPRFLERTGRHIYRSYHFPSEAGTYWLHVEQVQSAIYRMLNPQTEPVPDAITDLQVIDNGGGSYTFRWTAPQNSSTYQIKYSDKPIVEFHGFNAYHEPQPFAADGRRIFAYDNELGGTMVAPMSYLHNPNKYWAWWDVVNVKNVQGEPLAGLSGTAQQWTVSGLPAANLYFAIKSYNREGTVSGLSNLAANFTPDEIPPDAVSDLSATQGARGGQVNLSWTATGDDGKIGQAKTYTIKYAESAITESNWSQAIVISQSLTPKPSGQTETLTVSDLLGNKTYYFAIKATDDSNNTSVLSNIASINLPADTDSPIISNVSTGMISGKDSEVNILWTTDELANSQVEYGLDTNYSSTSALDTNYTKNHLVKIIGLSPNTLYHYRVISLDQNNNKTVSSDYSFTSSDYAPPVISNIQVSNIQSMQATITWATDEDSTSRVLYGTSDTNLDQSTTLDSNLVKTHSVILTALNADTHYYFKVESKDVNNNNALSGVQNFYTTPFGGMTEVWGQNSVSDHKNIALDNTLDKNNPTSFDNGLRAVSGMKIGLIYFDISDLPLGTAVSRAKLKLYKNTGDSKTEIGVYLVADPDKLGMWNPSSVCYNYRNKTSAIKWTNSISGPVEAIGRLINTITIPAKSPNGWFEGDVTEAVKGWVNNEVPNQGLFMQANLNWAYFTTSEAADVTKRPILEISYTSPPAPKPEITLTKSAQINGQPASEATIGNIITYTIAYQNIGTGEATNVVITDPIPAGTKFAGNITGNGNCLPASDETCNQIIWNINTVSAQGQPGSSGAVGFEVRVE